MLNFLQLLFVYLLLIPLLAFNMAGGTFIPLADQNPFPLQAIDKPKEWAKRQLR